MSSPDSENRREVIPALFIGLGGSGRDILRDIKRRLRAIYGGVLPDVFQFLYIDTAPLANRFGQEPIGQDEYVSLGECNPAEVAANAELYPKITAWLPDPDPGITNTRFGAGQRRYIGRMALFIRFPAVFEALSHKLADMKAMAAIEELRLKGYQVNDAAPQVYLFGSLAGGTGSGIFLDVAYLIRELAPEAFVTGVLCLSDIFYPVLKNYNNRSRADANCYAALLELDYHVHRRHFECDYGRRQITVGSAPFNTTYLVSLQNIRGNRLKRTDDAFRMIAHWAITQVAAGLGGQQREEMNNVAAAAQDMPPYQGHRRAYSSLVAAALLFPAEDIARYGGLRRGQTLIQTGYLGETDRTLNQVALITALEPDNLRRALRSDQELLASDPSHARSIQRATKPTAVFRALERQGDDQAEFLQALRSSMQERVPGLELTGVEALETAVWEAVRHAGFEAGITLVRGSHQRITEVIRVLEAEQDEAEGRRQDLEHRLRDARRQIEKLGRYAWLPWQRSRMRDMGHYASRLLAERDETLLGLSMLRTAIDIYRRLQEGVDQGRPEFRNLRQLEAALQVRRKELDELGRHFGRMAQEVLAGRVTSPEVFDLATPIVGGDYIQSFYETHDEPAPNITASFNEFNNGFADLNDFLTTSKEELQRRLITFTRRPFEALVADVRVLDLFKANPALKGDIRLDALLDRADVFLRFRGSQGFDELNDLAYTAHLGVDHWDPDEEAKYIEPALNKRHRAFSVTYTGDPHRIQVARTAHGLPLTLLADLDTYERSYQDLSNSGASPMHVDRRWPLHRQNGHWPWVVELRPVPAQNRVRAR